MSKKIKANRRKVVRAKKKAASEQAARNPRPPIAYGIAWACTDPACVEGIHHFGSLSDGDSR